MMRASLALVLAAYLSPQALSADVVEPENVSRSVVYLCDRGRNISVMFTGDTAQLQDEGSTVSLQQQPAASGIHYAGQGHDLRGKGPEAIWTDASGTVRNCMDQEHAMKQPQIHEPLAQLGGTRWQLVHFQSMDDAIGKVVPPRVERYTLDFKSDGALAMQLDCNRGMSRWQAEPTSTIGGGLTLSPAAMTRALCGEGAMDSQIAMDTTRIKSFTLANGQLNLALEADAGIYVWNPVQP